MTRAGAMFPGVFLALAAVLLFALPTNAGPLSGKKYIIQMTSSQMDSGYGNYLVPPLAKVFDDAGFIAMRGPGADIVVNIITHSDVGQWMKTASGRQWLYSVTITVGISPENYDIPYEGTPKFGIAATLVTPNGDREDELACLIGLAARKAIEKYQEMGVIKVSGETCLRRK